MILQVIAGALVTRKVIKEYRKYKETQELKAYGKSVNLPYIPGENLETYRKMLLETRGKIVVNKR